MAIKQFVVENKSFDISYEIVNPANKKDIIFLHGWGANKEIMKNSFSSYLKNFRHIYIDLPGFGKSLNDYVLTSTDYAKIVDEFLKLIDSKKDIIVGHSYGGKVATLLNPKNLVLLSSAGIVEEKSFSIKVKIFLAKILRALGLKALTKNFRSKDVEKMSENMYATFKNVLNEDFSEYFANFANNTLIFWGEDDTATSLDSGKEIANLIKNSKIVSYKGDHYFFMKNSDDISRRIENGIS